MSYILLIGLLFAGVAHAIENIDQDFTSTATREFEVVPGHRIALDADQVLINGQLHAARSRQRRDHIHYGIRDEMVGRRVFNIDREGFFPLTQGDQIFVLDPTRTHVLLTAEYDEATEPVVYTAGGDPQVIHVTRPIFRIPSVQSGGGGELSNEHLHRLFKGHEQVVMVRRLTEPAFRQMRERYLPLIQAHAAHQSNQDRFVRVTAKETLELAHFERADAGLFTYAMPGETTPALKLGEGYVQPAMKVWELILGITKPDGSKLRLNKNETMIFISGQDEVLMKYKLEQEKIILYEPYDAFEQHLCSLLMSVDRAVIIRSK